MKVAFIGMGTMGAPMALNLLNAGYDVTVHNRTRDKETSVAENGAKSGLAHGSRPGGGYHHHLRE